MKKYLAKIVYQIVGNEPSGQDQFDEQLCLIEARDMHEAFFKARMLGVKNEEEIDHESGHNVYWKFIDVPYINELQLLADGQELYSCITERDKEDMFANYVKKRAADIQDNVQHQLLVASAS
jgi:hypothetical protein